MNFFYSDEEEQFRREVREFIQVNLTPEIMSEHFVGNIRGPHAREFLVKMAKQGWLGISWPKKYGGLEKPAIYEFILNEELAYAKAPRPGIGVGIVGKTLIAHGSEWLKSEFLPKLLREEINFALGYSEPDAGSDLASLQLRAVKDGDEYLLNGQKLFCSSAHVAEWVWLAVRTDVNVPKHKGISILIVDLGLPGITIRGLNCMCGDRTNEVFFEDVRVPERYLVGELNQGFRYMMEALAYERHVLFPAGDAQRMMDSLINWVRDTEINGKKIKKDPIVRHKLARLATDMEVFRLLGLRVVDADRSGRIGNIEAAMYKLYGTHLEQRIANTALDIMGPYGQLKEGSEYVQANGVFEHAYRQTVIRTVGGGGSEIQKNIIAGRYLGLPRQ